MRIRTIARRLAAGLTIAILAAALGAGTAAAAPTGAPGATSIALDCGGAGTFEAITNGNGDFTPAHDLNSHRVLIPVSIGPTTFTARDAEGNVLFEEADATVNAKGHGAPRGRALLECTFTLRFAIEDGATATVTGTATGFLSGRR